MPKPHSGPSTGRQGYDVLPAAVYDFRGITDTLEEPDHLLGPLNRLLHKALDLYMARR